MVEKLLNKTTPYGKIRASHEGSLHSPTLRVISLNKYNAHTDPIFTNLNILKLNDIFVLNQLKDTTNW